MYTNTRFQSIGITSNCGTKFAQNYINGKTLGKTKIEIVLNM